MPNYVFKIFLDKKGEEYACQDDDLVTDPLERFAQSKNKKLEDFLFYYRGSLISYVVSQRIKNSIFSQNEGKITNIIAVQVSPVPTSSTSPEETKELKEKRENLKPGEEEAIEKNEIVSSENEEIKEGEEYPPSSGYTGPKRINKVYYNDVICPKCFTTAIIYKDKDDEDKKNLQLKILNCENFHYLQNIKYDQLDEFVFNEADESKENQEKMKKYKEILVCDLCSINRKDLTPPNDKLYKCICGTNICSNCYTVPGHDGEGHKKIDIDDKNYYCMKHGEKFSYYCIDCNANKCDKCKEEDDDEKTHEIIELQKIKPKKEEIQKLKDKVDNQKEILLDFVENTKLLFDKIINTIENYLNSYIMIENSLIRRFDLGQYNYQLFRNLRNKQLFDNKMFNKLDELNKPQKNEKETFEDPGQVRKLLESLCENIYKPIQQSKEDTDSKGGSDAKETNMKITITYKAKEGKLLDKKVKLFDPVFVENNKDKISMVVTKGKNDKGKPEDLKVYYDSTSYEEEDIIQNNEMTVILTEKQSKRVTDLSYMLNNCKYARGISFGDWKADDIVSMEAMFQLCDFDKLDEKLFSKFSTIKLENIRALFCKCTKLKAIPDLNSWFNNKDSQLKNMSMLFNGCKSLTSISILKNWYIYKLEDVSYMYNRCRNLQKIESLYFSKSKIKHICGIFNGCKKLTEYQLSFSAQDVKDMSIMFQDCASLVNLNNKFSETKNVENISGMFAGCKKLKKLSYSGISYVECVEDMVGLFKNCENLENLSDIKNWNNLTKVKKTKSMFYGCKKLINNGMISSLKFAKGKNYENILEG